MLVLGVHAEVVGGAGPQVLDDALVDGELVLYGLELEVGVAHLHAVVLDGAATVVRWRLPGDVDRAVGVDVSELDVRWRVRCVCGGVGGGGTEKNVV